MQNDELIAAVQQNLNSVVLSSQSGPIRTQSTPAVTQSWSSVSFPYFNIVADCHAGDDRAFTEILEPYRRHQSTAVWFQIASEIEDDRMQAHGLSLLDVRPCMAAVINTVPAPKPPGTIVQVQNESQLRDWVWVQSEANGGFPPVIQDTYVHMIHAALDGDGPIRAFVAYENGQAVACSLLHMAGDVAGIYQVATVPAARRKGYGTAITDLPLRYAARCGYTVSVLIATQMGRPVYEKMGFEVFTQASVYLYSPK